MTNGQLFIAMNLKEITQMFLPTKAHNRDNEKKQELETDVFIVNFEHISPRFLVFLLLTLNK